MATTRPVVVITIAAPWSALFPEARDRAIAPLSAFWATAWILALRLVTRSSPLAGGDCLTVPVTSPAALTDTTWVPARPRSWLSYWASRPAWPTRSTPEKPVTGRWRLLISSGVTAQVQPVIEYPKPDGANPVRDVL